MCSRSLSRKCSLAALVPGLITLSAAATAATSGPEALAATGGAAPSLPLWAQVLLLLVILLQSLWLWHWRPVRRVQAEQAQPVAGSSPLPVEASSRADVAAASGPSPAPVTAKPSQESLRGSIGNTELLYAEPTSDHEQAAAYNLSLALLDTLRYAPHRQDVRFQLIQLNFASGQTEAFLENARIYKNSAASANPSAANDENWPRIVAMGQELLPNAALFAHKPRRAEMPEPTARRHYDSINQKALTIELRKLNMAYGALHPVGDFRRSLVKMYLGIAERPTELNLAERLTKAVGGAQIFVKREDLRAERETQRLNAYGQALLAKSLGKQRLVCGTLSGHSGEAAARAAGSFGLGLQVYLPQRLLEDPNHPSVRLIRTLDGAITGVSNLDPRASAMEHWLNSPDDCFYLSGLDAGPPPYPAIVADILSVIGKEVLHQVRRHASEGLHACVCSHDAGSAALGFLQPMFEMENVELYYTQAAPPAGAASEPQRLRFARAQSWVKGSGRVQNTQVSRSEIEAAAERGERLEGFPTDDCNAAILAQAIRVAASLPACHAVVALLVNPPTEESQTSPFARTLQLLPTPPIALARVEW